MKSIICKKLLVLYLFTPFIYTSTAQNKLEAKWTIEDKKLYAKKDLDSTKWDLKKLEIDIKTFNKQGFDTPVLPLSNYPSPTTKYSGNGTFAHTINTRIDSLNIHIGGIMIYHYYDKYRTRFVKDTLDGYGNVFNILYVTDKPNRKESNISSRNYPHYIANGTQKTSKNSIDWVQMTLASGENYAIIARRFFDLEVGKTIFVFPLNDGTLRFYQLDKTAKNISIEDLTKGNFIGIYDFLEEIKQDKNSQTYLKDKRLLKVDE